MGCASSAPPRGPGGAMAPAPPPTAGGYASRGGGATSAATNTPGERPGASAAPHRHVAPLHLPGEAMSGSAPNPLSPIVPSSAPSARSTPSHTRHTTSSLESSQHDVAAAATQSLTAGIFATAPVVASSRRSVRRAPGGGAADANEAYLAPTLAAMSAEQPETKDNNMSPLSSRRHPQPSASGDKLRQSAMKSSSKRSTANTPSGGSGSPGGMKSPLRPPAIPAVLINADDSPAAAWAANLSPTTPVRSLRNKPPKPLRTGSSMGERPLGLGTGGGVERERSLLTSPNDRDRVLEKSVLQSGLASGYYGYSVFESQPGGGPEVSHLGERSQILREQEEEIIDRRHPPRVKGGKFVPEDTRKRASMTGHGRMSPSLSALDQAEEPSHTYTYHQVISHTRAGVEAEEERLRERARELAEEEREKQLLRKPMQRKPTDELYDKSQVINTSAYGYTHHTTRTAYHPQSVLHSYAAYHHRADSPLEDEDAALGLEVEPYPGEVSTLRVPGRGRVSATASPMPYQESAGDLRAADDSGSPVAFSNRLDASQASSPTHLTVKPRAKSPVQLPQTPSTPVIAAH